jgi:hypothetical protein
MGRYETTLISRNNFWCKVPTTTFHLNPSDTRPKRSGTNVMEGKRKKYSLIPVRTDLHTKFITEIYQLVNTSLWRCEKCQTNLTQAAVIHPHLSYKGKRSIDKRQRDTDTEPSTTASITSCKNHNSQP